MTGDVYDAATLERWNVVNRVWPADEFEQAARDLTASLSIGPTRAHAATKKVLKHYESGGIAEANAHITTIAADLYNTEDPRTALTSFLGVAGLNPRRADPDEWRPRAGSTR